MKMSRNLKALGLAVLAVSAIGATGASAAQAGTFTAGAYPATITGQNVGGSHEFTTALGVMKCGVKFHGTLAAASEDLTLVPDYGTTCQLEGNEVHVKNNGCDFLFHAGGTIAMHKVGGTVQIKCPAGNKMDFEITAMQVCHVTVGEQIALEHVIYTNQTVPKDVDADIHLTGLIYQLDFGCPFVGTFGATYSGTTTLASDNEGADSFGVD